jgi:hypothetical protein
MESSAGRIVQYCLIGLALALLLVGSVHVRPVCGITVCGDVGQLPEANRQSMNLPGVQDSRPSGSVSTAYYV